MPVVFDASFLIPLLDPKVQGVNNDPRIEYLFRTLDRQHTQIIIPTPALSEVLIGAGEAAPKYLEIINRSSRFRVASFGERAAVEAAAAHREMIDAGNKKETGEIWAKVKFDRQIVAIAKVEGADCIYSNDQDIAKYAKREGILVISIPDLPTPPKDEPAAQRDMFGTE